MSSYLARFKKYSGTFWVANLIELLERWGWYGFYMVFALYLTNSADTGALGFSQTEKGLIMGIGTAILYFLPVITGAIADKVGYKLVLIIAFAIYAAGFAVLGQVDAFFPVFFVFLFIAIGSALFKPVPAATIAKTTDEETSSIGFGIYYMMVNIGALIGPVLASVIRPTEKLDEAGNVIYNEAGKPLLSGLSWNTVFLVTAGVMVAGLLIVLLFYKEPKREKNADPIGKSILVILKNIGTSLLDFRLVLFLVIIIGFWTVYYQLFLTLPIFIDQWVDTTGVFNGLHNIWPWLATAIGTENGTISAELMTTMPAFYIVIFQLLISSLVMKWRPISAMVTGIFINTIGLGLTFMTQNGLYILISIFVFAIGEMSSSPKITEYLGRIAPKDKRALYIGTSFLPVAGGSFIAGLLSNVYENMSDKVTLLQREVAERGLQIPEISREFTQNNYISEACRQMGMSSQDLTDFLWSKYMPYDFWMVIVSIGVGTAILLFIYNTFILGKKRG